MIIPQIEQRVKSLESSVEDIHRWRLEFSIMMQQVLSQLKSIDEKLTDRKPDHDRLIILERDLKDFFLHQKELEDTIRKNADFLSQIRGKIALVSGFVAIVFSFLVEILMKIWL